MSAPGLIEAPERRARPRERVGLRHDLVGLGLLGAAAAWTFAAAAIAGGDPAPAAGVLLGTALAYAAGRIVSSAGRWIVPAAVVALAAGTIVIAPGEALSRSPLSGPFGYANAKGAFYAQAAIAAVMLVLLLGDAAGSFLAAAAALGLVAVTAASRSLAAAGTLVLAAAAWAATPGRARAAVAALGGVFLVAVVGTVGLGLGYHGGSRDGPVDRAIDATLSERRPALWHDALVIMRDHPLAGVGPGNFAEESPVARSDRDARWAHNGFLQQGAETGAPGLLLLVAAVVWGLFRLRAGPGPDRVSVLGAAALAALGIHASIDYILHFPAVPMATAALVAAGASPRRGGP